MGKRLTLFEFHSHGDIQIGPASLDDAVAAFDEQDTEADDSTADDDGSSAKLAALFGFVVLVALAAAVKYLTGDGEPVDLAESDDL